MDLGGGDWSGARSGELVKPTILAARAGASERHAAGSGWTGLEPMARASAGASVQSGVSAVFVARMVGLRVRRAGRYGIVQFRHDLSRAETGSTGECGSELHGPVRRDLSHGVDHPFRFPGTRRHASGEIYVV